MSILGEDDDYLNNAFGENELPDGNEEEGGNLFGEDNENNENENQEDGGNNGDDKPIKVEPKRRLVRNPRPKLSIETLSGPRGIQTIETYFKDIKFKGKGYEKQDLNEVLGRLQHWAHRMYPTYTFDDVLNNIERLSKKKPLQAHMSRYRLNMLLEYQQNEVNDDADAEVGGEGAAALPEDEPFDEFDALLGEQIAISHLAPKTPARNASRDSFDCTTPISSIATPSFNRGNNALNSTSYSNVGHIDDYEDLAQPLPPLQPEVAAIPVKTQENPLTKEQLERIAENRRIALERLKAKKLREQQQATGTPETVFEIT